MYGHLQHMILSALKAEFNFGQFLQGENLPGALVIVKEMLAEKRLLQFYLFRIFAAMCGILGVKNLEGSLFMHEQVTAPTPPCTLRSKKLAPILRVFSMCL